MHTGRSEYERRRGQQPREGSRAGEAGRGGHPPAPRIGARGVVSGVVGGARGGGGVGAGGRTAVASEAFELFTDGAAAPPAARAVGEELKALLIAAYAAHAAVDEPDTAMDTR